MTNSLEPSGFPGESASGSSSRWWWRLEDASGNEVRASDAAQGAPRRATRSRGWGEPWRELTDDGVDAVTLFEGDREVYGPMSLHANT